MTVNFSKDKFNLREKLKELERPSVDKLVTKDKNGAYIDTIRGNTKLESISSSVSGTAVDVFVYDTRKDSDGGAWRKRTQNTSWYNETLGTATRGTRKKFPAVAVIVAETSKVTIYDGDDPDLPMWMVFEVGRTPTIRALNWHTSSVNSTISSTFQLNGKLCIGSAGGVTIFDFVSDNIRLSYNVSNWELVFKTISNRNDIGGAFTGGNGYNIVSPTTNDVAMTVLPNAPIDSATGLPVPTIAVATESGTSVIRDDETVADYTGFSPIKKVATDSKYVYVYARSEPNDYIFKSTFLLSDGVYNTNITAGSGGFYVNSIGSPVSPLLKNMNATNTVVAKDHTYIRSGNDGIEILDGNVTTVDADTAVIPIAYITSDYNTGYMVGDIKGAFLSDTDTTNLTGGNLVSNGDAWSGAQSSTSSTPPTGWTGALGAQWLTSSGGDGSYIRLVNAGSSQGGPNSYMYQAITTVAGRKYKISLTQYHHATITVFFAAATTAGGTDLLNTSFTSASGNTPRELFGEFTATGTTTYIRLGVISASNDYWVGWDNVVVTEVDEDRSVNAHGLHSFGTITKSAVATGAELVAYSGFSGNNLLVQPYNSNLNPGTGDYSFTFWFKCSATGSEQIYMRRFGVPTVTGGMMMRLVSSSSVIQWYVRDTSSTATAVNSTTALDDGNWHCIVGTREGSTAKLYIDGKLNSSSGCSANSHDPGTTSSLVIGAEEISSSPGTYQNPADSSSMALMRYSLSAPSAEQIKKMYEDEKFLFQENAKATLYGSSDAATALAFDDTTNLLHVGTSAGRSEFQGLRRINNTTDAVTTAISASNGLVAEQ